MSGPLDSGKDALSIPCNHKYVRGFINPICYNKRCDWWNEIEGERERESENLKQKARPPLWSATLDQTVASDGSMWTLTNNRNSLARNPEEEGQRRDREQSNERITRPSQTSIWKPLALGSIICSSTLLPILRDGGWREMLDFLTPRMNPAAGGPCSCMSSKSF